MEFLRSFVYAHFEHVLFALLLLSRIGDVFSTWLATPTLKLEANPIVRRLRWPFAVATIAVSFIAYVDTALAMMLLVPFLLVCSSNFAKVWTMRTMGEEAYLVFLLGLVRKGRLSHAIAGVIVAASFVAVAGVVLMVMSRDGQWGIPFGMGLVLYAGIQAFYGSLSFVRYSRMARSMDSATM